MGIFILGMLQRDPPVRSSSPYGRRKPGATRAPPHRAGPLLHLLPLPLSTPSRARTLDRSSSSPLRRRRPLLVQIPSDFPAVFLKFLTRRRWAGPDRLAAAAAVASEPFRGRERDEAISLFIDVLQDDHGGHQVAVAELDIAAAVSVVSIVPRRLPRAAASSTSRGEQLLRALSFPLRARSRLRFSAAPKVPRVAVERRRPPARFSVSPSPASVS